ncbi:MAG: glycosyltransferase family A protein, partial [Solirubrobacteraceae bacterium]
MSARRTAVLDSAGAGSDADRHMTRRDLSVIIPAFNVAPYIRESIQTTLECADRLLEVIVVDDGSTDETARVAASFGDRIVLLRQGNHGPSSARNAGMRVAHGKYVGFLDGDDPWSAPSPDPRLTALDADPSLGAAYGFTRRFVEDAFGNRSLAEQTAVGTTALVVRRDLLLTIGGFDERLTHGEDLDLMVRLRETGRGLQQIDEIVAIARAHAGSLTSDTSARLGSRFTIGRA